MLAAAPFEPDKGPFSETTTDYVMNVTPIANGYGPFPDLSALSTALASQCYGGCYFRSSTGSFGVIAATVDKLWRLDTSSAIYGWTDISGPSAPYAIPTGQLVQFERFGTKLFACSLGMPLQQYDVDAGGVFSDTPGSPPRSKYIKTIGDFLMLAYLKVGATEFPQKWATSALNNTDVWTAGVNLADDQTEPDGDEITGIMAAVDGGRLFQRRAKRSLLLSADVAMPIKQHVIDPSYGVIAPYSIVAIGSDDYVYLAEDGFQRGDAKTPIGAERVNRFFFDTVDTSKLERVQGVNDPFNHMVWWTYQDTTQAYRMIGYDWELDKWVQSDAAVQVLIPIVTPGVTLEALTAIFLALYGSSSIDTPGAESFDSPRWKGGRPLFGAIGTDFILYLFTGSPRAASIDTTAQVLSGDVSRRTKITGAYPVSDTNSCLIAKTGGDKHGDVNTLAFGAGTAMSTRTGLVPLRGDHRIVRFRTSIPTATDWNYFHGIEPQIPGAAGRG